MTQQLHEIIQRHTEAMHDDVAGYLRKQRALHPIDREHMIPGQFARDMYTYTQGGMMHLSEYKEWYTEEVGE